MQYRFKIEALRHSWNPDLTCRYDYKGKTRTFGRATLETTTENVPAYIVPLHSVIEKEGRKFYYKELVFEEKNANAFKDFITSHPMVSVPDRDGNETNPNIQQAHYKFIDDTAFHAQEVEFAKMVTAARIKIHEAAEDENMLWELAWFVEVTPLHKTKNEVHVLLLDKANKQPSVFVAPDEQTELSALVFKASRLTGPTGNTIIYKMGERYVVSDEPAASYSTLHELASNIAGHPDRINALRQKVDAATKAEFTWSPSYESGKTAAIVNSLPIVTKEDVVSEINNVFSKLEGKTPHHTSMAYKQAKSKLQDIKIECNGKTFDGEKLDVDSIVRDAAKQHSIKADLFKLS